jgi:hypothetical protein
MLFWIKRLFRVFVGTGVFPCFMKVYEDLLSDFPVLFVFFRKYVLLIGQNYCSQKSVKPEFYLERGQLSQTSALSEK